MDNLISETNNKLQSIASSLQTIKDEYESKLEDNTKEMSVELETVKKYKEEFFSSKQKVEKMNSDIEGFERDYQNLVERFKDDELANILIAANKEISSKIEERKRKIIRDKKAMNELVAQAEVAKEKLVKLNAEKAALEVCLAKISDACEFYSTAIDRIVSYTESNEENLCNCFHEKEDISNEKELSELEQEINNITVEEDILNQEIPIVEEDDEDDDEVTEIILDDIDDDEEEEISEQKDDEEDNEKLEEIVLDEEEQDEEEEFDKTIIMDAIVDQDKDSEFNISDEDIEKTLTDLDLDEEDIEIDDELEEDDSLYKKEDK